MPLFPSNFIKRIALLVLPIAMTGHVRRANADIVFIDHDTLACPIYEDDASSPYNSKAAGELAGYLTKISGKYFVVKPLAEPLPERAIIIGAHDLTPAETAKVATLGLDGFLVVTHGQRLHIVGGGGKGVCYGVFDFLEHQLGCRWWSWNEEDVPTSAVIKIGDVNYSDKPAFEYHDIFNFEAQRGGNDFEFKSRSLSTLQFIGRGSNMYDLLTPAATEHPVFWPMGDNGARGPNKLHFNYLAPGIDQALADALSGVVGENNGNLKNSIYFAGQGDWYGGLDQSPESKAAYAVDGASGPLIGMINRTAAILDKKYPGIKVGTFAYMSTDAPPLKTVPGPNVNIWLPRLRYGTTLGIEDAASDKMTNAGLRATSNTIKESIEKWAKIAPGRFYIWEYGSNYSDFTKPWPTLRSMAQNIRYYHRIGVAGIMIQSNYVSFGGDLAVLKNWIWARLLWNPDQDVDALLKQFCDGYYGPGSVDMQAYVNALEDSVHVPYWQMDEFTSGTPYLTPAVLAKMNAALASGREHCAGAANVDYLRRVNEAGASLDALELWTWGSLGEKDGRIVRTDIDKEHGGTYTHDRAVTLFNSLRGSSRSEWGAGPTQERGILAANGGPLYTMKRAQIAARISPWTNGRLWDLSYGGRKILAASNAPGSEFFVPMGTPTNDKLGMEGEWGYGNWHPTPLAKQREVYVLDADGFLHDDVFLQALDGGQTVSPLAVSSYFTTDLADAQKFTVEIKSEDGWTTLPIASFKGAMPGPNDIDTTQDFEVRVTTPDKKLTITEYYDDLPANGVFVGYSESSNCLDLAVRLAPVTNNGILARAYSRSFRIAPVTAPTAARQKPDATGATNAGPDDPTP